MTDSAVVLISETGRELVAAWVVALESGDYDQGYQRLRTNDTYCCLGVLADLAIKREAIDARWEIKGDFGPDGQPKLIWKLGGPDGGGEDQVMPPRLSRMIGLESDGGPAGSWSNPNAWKIDEVGDGVLRSWPTLASANDSAIIGFPAIAGAIRNYYNLPAWVDPETPSPEAVAVE